MDTLLQIILVLFLLVGIFYVQRQIPAYTDGSGKVILTRLILFVVGAGFGFMGASYVEGPIAKALAFLIGFGFVHLPAAVVLLIKSMRGEGKS